MTSKINFMLLLQKKCLLDQDGGVALSWKFLVSSARGVMGNRPWNCPRNQSVRVKNGGRTAMF